MDRTVALSIQLRTQQLNFGTKLILFQNWGHVFAPIFGKEMREGEIPKEMASRDQLRKK